MKNEDKPIIPIDPTHPDLVELIASHGPLLTDADKVRRCFNSIPLEFTKCKTELERKGSIITLMNLWQDGLIAMFEDGTVIMRTEE